MGYGGVVKKKKKERKAYMSLLNVSDEADT
jgi:hypothetical protein